MEQAMERWQAESSRHETYAATFKALANLSRLKLISLLSQHEELCVCELEAALGHKQSLVSYHLTVLENAGLVTHREEGTWSYYKLNEERLRELLSPQCCESVFRTRGDINMSKKGKDKDSEGFQGIIKKFLGAKGSGCCCNVRIEEVEEEKTGEEVETARKK